MLLLITVLVSNIGIILSDSALPTYYSHVADPGAGCSSDSVGIVGGVSGALMALLLAYGVVTTIVIVVLMLRIRRGKVPLDQPVYAG